MRIWHLLNSIILNLKNNMKKIFFCLLFLLGIVIVYKEVKADTLNFKLYVVWNIHTYDFKECTDIKTDLYLTYKWNVIKTTQFENDNFQDNEIKRIWKFSFMIDLPQEKLNLEDYKIVTSENEVFELKKYDAKTRIIQDNIILVPDVWIFCNKSKLNSLIQKSYEENKDKYISEWIYTKNTRDFEMKQISIIEGNKKIETSEEGISITGVNIVIRDKISWDLVYERKNTTLPLIINGIEELSYFKNTLYEVSVSKDWYNTYKTNLILNSPIVSVTVYLSQKNTNPINLGNEYNTNWVPESPAKDNSWITSWIWSETWSVADLDNKSKIWVEDTDNSIIKIRVKLLNKKKDSKYTIIVNGEFLEEMKEYPSTIQEKKIDIYRDNKFLLSKKINSTWTLMIDVWETSIFYYIIWVSLSFFLILVYFIIKKKYITKLKN